MTKLERAYSFRLQSGNITVCLVFLFYLKARPFTLSPELARQVLQVHRAEKEFDGFHNEVKPILKS